MGAKRSEPFLRALTELRGRVAAGVYPAETRLAAAELAAELGLSPTPMREALARLTGEGLLEDRRGQGFFLRRLSPGDIADLYRLNLAHLEIALQAPRLKSARSGQDTVPGVETEDAALEAADRLLARWVGEAGGPLLRRSYLRSQLQLARVRRVEPAHFDGLAAEFAELAIADAAPPRQRLARVRPFFRRRIRLAARLAESLEPAR